MLLKLLLLLQLMCRIAWCSDDVSPVETSHLQAARATAFWQADLVVVVSWFNKDIDWLSVYPASRVVFAVWAKGNIKRCSDFPDALKPQLRFCKDDNNAGGREAYVIADFCLRFYDQLPRYALFTQDDTGANPSHDLVPGMSDAEWSSWLRRAEHVPFSNSQNCLCAIIHEHTWFNSSTYSWYDPMAWMLQSLLGFDTSGWTSTRWPEAANFVVPRAAVRSRPRVLYSVLVQLLNGTAELEEPSGGRPAPDTPLLFGRWSMLQMAHSLERTWFAVFDARFSPHQVVYDARIAEWEASLKRDFSHLSSGMDEA